MNRQEAFKIAEAYFEEKISALKSHVNKAVKSASDAPGAMESWSDKSKDEFTQLARALSGELKPLEKSLAQLKHAKSSDKISSGSLVQMLLNGKESYVLIVESGGEKVDGLFLLSKNSELGQTLTGHKAGDTIPWRSGNIQILRLQ